MRARTRSWSRPVVALAFLIAAPAHPVEYDLRVVARTGDPVPGLPGQTIVWLSTNPFFGGSPPRLSPEGTVAFAAGWNDEFPFPHGLFREGGAGLDVIALVGDAAPGTATTFDGFPQPAPGAPRNPGNAYYSFDATITEEFSTDGVWANRGGDTELIFRQLDTPPGVAGPASWFQWFHTMVPSGDVVLIGRYSTGGTSHINQTGFWRDDDVTFAPIVMAGDPAPGSPPGAVFGNGTVLAIVPFQTWSHDTAGHIAFNGMVMEGGTDWFDDEGVWQETDGGLVPVAIEGQPAPTGDDGAFFSGYEGFRTFGSSQVPGVFSSPSGLLAFGAHFDVPGVGYPFTSVWTTRDGDLELLARGRIPDAEGPGGDAAPGFPDGAVFDDFDNARINDLGHVVFEASVTVGGAGQPFGIWVDRGDGLELVVRGSQAIPDQPGETFSFPRPVVLHADGTILFLAQRESGGLTGLYRADVDGTLQTILVPGDPVEVAPGDVRVLSSLLLGEGTTPLQELVVQLTFVDGSQAIVVTGPSDVVTVPPQVVAPIAIRMAPSPFRARTSLSFRLDEASPVRLGIYDVTGRQVSRLLDDRLAAGSHRVSWDGRDGAGRTLPAGTYLVRLTRGATTTSGKIVRVD